MNEENTDTWWVIVRTVDEQKPFAWSAVSTKSQPNSTQQYVPQLEWRCCWRWWWKCGVNKVDEVIRDSREGGVYMVYASWQRNSMLMTTTKEEEDKKTDNPIDSNNESNRKRSKSEEERDSTKIAE